MEVQVLFPAPHKPFSFERGLFLAIDLLMAIYFNKVVLEGRTPMIVSMSKGMRRFARRCLAEARAKRGHDGVRAVTRMKISFNGKREEVVTSLLRNAVTPRWTKWRYCDPCGGMEHFVDGVCDKVASHPKADRR